MRRALIFGLSVLGIVIGLISAWYFSIERPAQPPVFRPVTNPYPTAIYANGIIESDQAGGSNITVFPEVSGVVSGVHVAEGQQVAAGTLLLTIDDSVQRANAQQLRLQEAAAGALLAELHAQPRAETLTIAAAQVTLALATLKTARDQSDKRRASYELDSRSISRDALDTAADAVSQAEAALLVSRRQYDLVKAGAWSYDITNQARTVEALHQASAAANALLAKFSIRARVAGVVLALNVTSGSVVSGQGAYDAYTEGFDPVVVMSAPQDHLAIRCFVDEILVSRLPAPGSIRAEAAIRGTTLKVPLEFVRVQPYVSPKIELSNQRQEKVDLRVLPVIFRFSTRDVHGAYPGQLVDVFIGPK